MGVGRLFANVFRQVKVLSSDNNCSEFRVPNSFGIAVQPLCCDDADYCLRPASLPHESDDDQRHDESGEGSGLGVEQAEEGCAAVEGNEASGKGIDFVSRIVCIGQEVMQGDMGEEWKMAVVVVARHT